MKRSLLLAALLCMAAVSTFPAPAGAQDNVAPTREDARLVTATDVLEMQRSTPDQNIPAWLMQRAYGVAVIPEVIKGALFLFGGRYGNGVLTVRNAQGRFSNPIFITLAGGSVGFQIGATSTDVVLVFVTQRSVQNFARGKFTLGVDASVAAGPVGRQGEAAAGVNAEIYSYSRSRGLFAGVALDGTVLAFDRGANRAFYANREVTTDMITSGQVGTRSESARRFLGAVVADTGAAAVPDAAETPAGSAVAPAPPVAPSADHTTHTYPLQDTHPGAEPKP
jgi:lipid-binding SYLF domain-containing protein